MYAEGTKRTWLISCLFGATVLIRCGLLGLHTAQMRGVYLISLIVLFAGPLVLERRSQARTAKLGSRGALAIMSLAEQYASRIRRNSEPSF